MREIAPSLKALADSPARVNRDMARQLAIPLGLSKEVEELCENHECYICGRDIEYCYKPACMEEKVYELARKHFGWNRGGLGEPYRHPLYFFRANKLSLDCFENFWEELKQCTGVGTKAFVGNFRGTRYEWICEVARRVLSFPRAGA